MVKKIKSVVSDSSIVLIIILVLNTLLMAFKTDADTIVGVLVTLYCFIATTIHNYLVSHNKEDSKLDKVLFVATILGMIGYIIFVVYRTWIY